MHLGKHKAAAAVGQDFDLFYLWCQSFNSPHVLPSISSVPLPGAAVRLPTSPSASSISPSSQFSLSDTRTSLDSLSSTFFQLPAVGSLQSMVPRLLIKGGRTNTQLWIVCLLWYQRRRQTATLQHLSSASENRAAYVNICFTCSLHKPSGARSDAIKEAPGRQPMAEQHLHVSID